MTLYDSSSFLGHFYAIIPQIHNVGKGTVRIARKSDKVMENIDSGKIYELTDLGIIYTFQVSHAP